MDEKELAERGEIIRHLMKECNRKYNDITQINKELSICLDWEKNKQYEHISSCLNN